MKLSSYYHIARRPDSTGAILSTFTGALAELDATSLAAIERLAGGADANGHISDSLLGTIPQGTLNSLRSAGIIIPDDTDERAIIDYDRVCSSFCGAPSFRILTTTGCNAFCPYCYEKGTPIIKMGEATAHDVAKYIEKNTKSNHFRLEWFGGEPLTNIPAIDIVTYDLEASGTLANATVSMVSNGILFDEALVQHAVETWQLSRVQTTLDGTEAHHNIIKQRRANGDAFSRTLHGIELLDEAGIDVSIRMNVNSSNEDDLSQMLRNIAPRLANRKHVSAYAYPLFEATRSVPKDEVLVVIRLTELLVELGFRDGAGAYPLEYRKGRCLATSNYGATIAPNGTLLPCSHVLALNDMSFGTIHGTNIYNSKRLAWVNATLPQYCDDCILLPLCQGGCKVGELNLSRINQCLVWKEALDEMILSFIKLYKTGDRCQ